MKYTREFAKKYRFEYNTNISEIEDTSLDLIDIGKNAKNIVIALSHNRDHAYTLYNTICSIITCQFLPDRDDNMYYVYTDSFELKIENDISMAYVYYPKGEEKEYAIYVGIYTVSDLLDILYSGLCKYFYKTHSIRFIKEYLIDEILSGNKLEYIDYTLKRWSSVLRYTHEYRKYHINFDYISLPYVISDPDMLLNQAMLLDESTADQ
jgi:hypothetical protein